MSARRVLVTGVGGFVGGHLTRRLAERGDEISGVGLMPPPDEIRQRLVADLRADVADADALRTAVRDAQPDVVIHLAAQSSGSRSFEQPVETFRANAIGTWNLLEAVREGAPRARVLVVGTGDVYGPQPHGSRVAETAPFRPVNPYALSKAAADAMAEVAARAHGLDVVRTRSFAHTGPGQSPTFVVASFARQIAEIEAGRAEPVLRVGNLDVVRDISDVRDVVEAYLALIERGRSGGVYNVCRGEGQKLGDVAAQLVELAHVSVRIEIDPARVRPADVPWLVGDPSAMTRDAGWRHVIPSETTLADVLGEERRRLTAG